MELTLKGLPLRERQALEREIERGTMAWSCSKSAFVEVSESEDEGENDEEEDATEPIEEEDDE